MASARRFGKISDASSRELAAEAFRQALSDADASRKNISALVVCSGTHNIGGIGMYAVCTLLRSS